MTDGYIEVPDVSHVVGGFPCVDVSMLNNARDDHVIANGNLRTGAVFRHIRAYATRRAELHKRPKFFILENVLGLLVKPKGPSQASSNLDYVIKDLEVDMPLALLPSFSRRKVSFGFHVYSRARGPSFCGVEDLASEAQMFLTGVYITIPFPWPRLARVQLAS